MQRQLHVLSLEHLVLAALDGGSRVQVSILLLNYLELIGPWHGIEHMLHRVGGVLALTRAIVCSENRRCPLQQF